MFCFPDFSFELEQELDSQTGSAVKFLTYWDEDMVSNGLLTFIVAITLLEIGTTVYKTLRYGVSYRK